MNDNDRKQRKSRLKVSDPVADDAQEPVGRLPEPEDVSAAEELAVEAVETVTELAPPAEEVAVREEETAPAPAEDGEPGETSSVEPGEAPEPEAEPEPQIVLEPPVPVERRPEPETAAMPEEEAASEPTPEEETAGEPEAVPSEEPEPEPETESVPRALPRAIARARQSAAAPPEPKTVRPDPSEDRESAPKRAAKRKPKPKKPRIDAAKRFRRVIRETGPISLAQYMGESNALYYDSRDPLGGDEGDFITAPEISQMFGELIGLWLADIWTRAGSPEKVHYVELGPGRGTLASDALRTAGRYGLLPEVHFVEGSETLREIQQTAVPGVTHHHDLSTVPDDAPILLVANEFFDALPVHQLLRSADGWFERMVGLDGNRLVFVAGDKPMDSIVPPSWRSATQGTLIETSPAAAAVMSELADRLVAQGGAALVVDYGGLEHRSGSTLQAIRAHKKVDPLAKPGEADLTAHVDFEMLSQIAKRQGAEVTGVTMQGEWLRALGIETRAEALQRKAPRQADKIARQLDRLIAENQMGLLFKVMGLTAPGWPAGVGF